MGTFNGTPEAIGPVRRGSLFLGIGRVSMMGCRGAETGAGLERLHRVTRWIGTGFGRSWAGYPVWPLRDVRNGEALAMGERAARRASCEGRA